MKSFSTMTSAALRLVVAVIMTALAIPAPQVTLGQTATPGATFSCETVSSAVGTPAMGHDAMDSMAMASPAAAMDVDQMYIDMMIPHHQSIIAMAQAALPNLEDERLREIAQAVITTQQPEIDELRELRETLYGAAEPMPMGDAMMGGMDALMPGMAGMTDEMAFQMDPAAQVAAICAAEDTDLAFIDLTIPHHEMAIMASEVLREQTERPELRDFAERVIVAQQAEIDQLTEIRAELTAEGTPANP